MPTREERIIKIVELKQKQEIAKRAENAAIIASNSINEELHKAGEVLQTSSHSYHLLHNGELIIKEIPANSYRRSVGFTKEQQVELRNVLLELIPLKE